MLAATFGLCGVLTPLTGERDANFRLAADDGRDYVVKVSHPAEEVTTVQAQAAASLHVLAVDPDAPVQPVVRTRAGSLLATLVTTGAPRAVRVLGFMAGVPLRDAPLTPALCRALGETLARIDRALSDFADPHADQRLLWDVKQADQLRPLLPLLASDPAHAAVCGALERFAERVSAGLARLHAQPIHNDFNPSNLLVDPAGANVTGVLDFGDMVVSPPVCDVAVAISYLLGARPDPLAAVCEFVHAYCGRNALDAESLLLLPDLVATRLAMTVLISEWRAREHPANAAYILRNNSGARRGLELLDGRGRVALAARLAAMTG